MSSQDASPSFPIRKNSWHLTNISSWWWLLSKQWHIRGHWIPAFRWAWPVSHVECPSLSTLFFLSSILSLSIFLRDSPVSKSVVSGSPFKANFSLCTIGQAEFWSQDTKDQVSLDLANCLSVCDSYGNCGVLSTMTGGLAWTWVPFNPELLVPLHHEFSHELNEGVGNFSSGSEKESVMSWSMRKVRWDERSWRMWIHYL